MVFLQTSRQFLHSAEWMLSDRAFSHILKKIGYPKVYLFASRANKKFPKYGKPNPGSIAIDAFSVTCNFHFN